MKNPINDHENKLKWYKTTIFFTGYWGHSWVDILDTTNQQCLIMCWKTCHLPTKKILKSDCIVIDHWIEGTLFLRQTRFVLMIMVIFVC